MKYEIVCELGGTLIPCTFQHGNISMRGSIVLFSFTGPDWKFVCHGCGFIMHGGSPLTCGACGSRNIHVGFETQSEARP